MDACFEEDGGPQLWNADVRELDIGERDFGDYMAPDEFGGGDRASTGEVVGCCHAVAFGVCGCDAETVADFGGSGL